MVKDGIDGSSPSEAPGNPLEAGGFLSAGERGAAARLPLTAAVRLPS